VLFSSSFQTIASVIPAFSSSGDYLIVDKGVNLAAQNGALLSRSEVIWVNHNDVEDIQRALDSLSDVFRKKKKRVFLIIEGIYSNYGDICPLPQIMELKNNYPFRIIIDESYSIGVLGDTGRGLTEHFNVPIQDIEIVIGSLCNTFGGVGGFAVASKIICNHMRLNCTGYVFSASLPPYISASCITAVDIVKEGEDLRKLSKNAQYLNEKLKDLKGLSTKSDPLSPLIHLYLDQSKGSSREDQKFLGEIVNQAYNDFNIILSHTRYLDREIKKRKRW